MGPGAGRQVGDGSRSHPLRLGLVVAMEKEYRQVLPHLFNARRIHLAGVGTCGSLDLPAHEGGLGRHSLVVICSGIGKVNAALATQRLLAHAELDGMLSVGVSGGLLPDASVCQQVIGNSFTYHDVWCGEPNAFGQIQGFPPLYESDVNLVERIHLAAPHAVEGCFLCGEYFVPEKEAVRRMLEHFPGAVAVDMESCAVAQTCYVHGMPFASMRLLSDTPGRSADHGAQYVTFWNHQAPQAFSELMAALSML